MRILVLPAKHFMIKKSLFIIIPCYNEEDSIEKLLAELLASDYSETYSIHPVVVNDKSTDNTLEIIKRFPVFILDLPINLGIGGAMQTGYKFAFSKGADLVVQMDGDGQHPPSELGKLLSAHESSGYDVVIGSRFIDKKGFQSTILRRSGIKYLCLLSKIFTGRSIKDITSGFRLLNKRALTIVANDYPDEFPEPDSLITFTQRGLSIMEVPVIMRDRQGGKSSIQYVSQLYYITKVTLSMFFSYLKNRQLWNEYNSSL